MGHQTSGGSGAAWVWEKSSTGLVGREGGGEGNRVGNWTATKGHAAAPRRAGRPHAAPQAGAQCGRRPNCRWRPRRRGGKCMRASKQSWSGKVKTCCRGRGCVCGMVRGHGGACSPRALVLMRVGGGVHWAGGGCGAPQGGCIYARAVWLLRAGGKGGVAGWVRRGRGTKWFHPRYASAVQLVNLATAMPVPRKLPASARAQAQAPALPCREAQAQKGVHHCTHHFSITCTPQSELTSTTQSLVGLAEQGRM